MFRKMSNGKSNFFIRKNCLGWLCLFLIRNLGGLCNTLKFEKVLLDYNDQCHGWWATASGLLWVPGQGSFAGNEQAEGSGSLPMICVGTRFCLLKDTRASIYPQTVDERTTAPMRQRGMARPVTQEMEISLSVRFSTLVQNSKTNWVFWKEMTSGVSWPVL